MNKYLLYLTALLLFLTSSCGNDESSGQPHSQPAGNQPAKPLSKQEKDYVERFNVTAKDIRDFPPAGKDIEKYFYVFKSVNKLEDAKIFFFGETHTHALNQVWSAGVINRLIKDGDVVLFEGAQSGTKVADLSENITTDIFAAREYERLKAHKSYVPTAISKMRNKYWSLYFSTKEHLAVDELNFKKGQGFYWDLVQGNSLHPDLAKRNESMVQTIKDNLTGDKRVFVVAGSLHLPHYEFAHIKKESSTDFALYQLIGGNANELNDAFYAYFDVTAGAFKSSTKSIFEYLKGKDYAVLIPKNKPGAQSLSPYYPKKWN